MFRAAAAVNSCCCVPCVVVFVAPLAKSSSPDDELVTAARRVPRAASFVIDDTEQVRKRVASGSCCGVGRPSATVPTPSMGAADESPTTAPATTAPLPRTTNPTAMAPASHARGLREITPLSPRAGCAACSALAGLGCASRREPRLARRDVGRFGELTGQSYGALPPTLLGRRGRSADEPHQACP
jgi:hypothetical protein